MEPRYIKKKFLNLVAIEPTKSRQKEPNLVAKKPTNIILVGRIRFLK